MSDAALFSLVLDEIQKRFVLIFQDLSLEDLKFKSEKNSPALGWIAGHLTGGQHAYLRIILQGQEAPHLQEFSNFSTGTSSCYDYSPSIARIVKLFEIELNQMKKFVQNLSDEQLNSALPHSETIPLFFRDKTMKKILANYLAHKLMHLGQALEVRRLLDKNLDNINS